MDDQQLIQKLEEQRLELNDSHLQAYECPFCRQEGPMDRVAVFQHMKGVHGCHLGHHNSIVGLSAYLQMIRQQLDRFECLFCLVKFRDGPTLRRHMRKMKHFHINYKNHQYDQFYIRNYSQIAFKQQYTGVQQQQQQLQLRESERVVGDEHGAVVNAVVEMALNELSDDDDDEEGDWEWEQWAVGKEHLRTQCLMCDQMCEDAWQLIDQHMVEKHKFDLRVIAQQQQLDYYACVKLCNYSRRLYLETGDYLTLEEIMKLIVGQQQKWMDSRYLLPTYDDDMLLSAIDFDIESIKVEEEGLR